MSSERLRRIAERVGAMSLRERIFVFAAVVVAALALVQWLLIDPADQRIRQARDRLQAAGDGLAELARQQAKAGAPVDPDQALRARLAALEARLTELNTRLEAGQRSLVPPDRMAQVLKDMVKGSPALRVIGFRSLAPQPLPVPGAAEGAPAGVFRHGFEITLAGHYEALVAYLERLEALPWRLEWSEARLDAAGRPELTLTLTVHTLSLEDAWLRV